MSLDKFNRPYSPADTEKTIYQRWLDSGYFNPDNLPNAKKRKPYAIIMPPPNANAPLHVGHALGMTIEDILIRYQRMQGRRTLWLPGADHAGFETQVVFEKKLEKQGTSRFKMTREEFYKQAWDFVQANKHLSEEGIKRLGASCDWSRNIFTLDDKITKTVYETFEQLYKDGLVYRAGRICNWCPKHQTGLADLETKYEERLEPFYYFKYGPFTIGTSRPETKFGDKYVVMHPNDKRYKDYKQGQKIDLEWINGPITATIIKDSAVDMEFGSGVMTITPAHDPIDFDIAQRHKLDLEQIIDKRGKLLPIAGEFAGYKILDARPKIIEKLKQKGLLEKIDDKYKHSVQLCYKCGNLIEPQIIPQWYIATTKKDKLGKSSLRDMAVSAVKKKKVEIVTKRFENVFFRWMENLRDWPISRQIWWGIPIPVKYCDDCNEIIIDIKNTTTVCPKCKGGKLTSDPDTFDTWFSSGQWPFATLMASGKSDLKGYFPTQVMETGWDIIFFWVARMIMLSCYKTGKPPFEKVLLHGLVRDRDRQKMSKSKGNVIDPLGVIDLYGTDALRMALIFSTAAGNDIPLDETKISGMKKFANKLWNIARFVITNLENYDLRFKNYELKPQTKADRDILKKLDQTITTVTKNIESFNLHEAAQEIYQFTWHEFADIYIEASKEQLKNEKLKESTHNILFLLLNTVLRLLHPFMPFITEEIWSELGSSRDVKKPKQNDLLMITSWPK